MKRYKYRVHVFNSMNKYVWIAQFTIRAFSFKRSLKHVRRHIDDMGIVRIGEHIGIVELLT